MGRSGVKAPCLPYLARQPMMTAVGLSTVDIYVTFGVLRPIGNDGPGCHRNWSKGEDPKPCGFPRGDPVCSGLALD
jgi:hypothetical protein